MVNRALGRRRLFWSAVFVAVVALVTGSVFAYITYTSTSGPDGAVKGYFAALARGDAPAALGFGDLAPGPPESHELLTSKVLHAQRDMAQIRHVSVIAIERSGARAKVTVQYDLDFAAGRQQIADTVQVVRRDGSWRLAQAAAVTRLRLRQAADRATILGRPVPDGTLQVFPGAVPIEFDTPYLRLEGTTSSVPLSAGPETSLKVEITPAGHNAAEDALAAALTSCLSGDASAEPRCPVPSDRAVPGSLRARVKATDVRHAAEVSLEASARGLLTISGTIDVSGSYDALDFENQPVAKTGAVSLPLSATAYATAPITIDWGGAG